MSGSSTAAGLQFMTCWPPWVLLARLLSQFLLVCTQAVLAAQSTEIMCWFDYTIQNSSPVLPPLLLLTSCCLHSVVVESISAQQGVQYHVHCTDFLKFLLLFGKCSFFLITSRYSWLYMEVFPSPLPRGLTVVPVTFGKETSVIKGPVWGSGQASMVEQLKQSIN